MPQATTRSSGRSPNPSSTARQTRSTMFQGTESRTLVSGSDSTLSPETPKHTARHTNKHTLSHKTKSMNNNTTHSQAGEGGSDAEDDEEEPPSSNDGQDEDEQPAVTAPSYGINKKNSHKAGRNHNRAQTRKSESPGRTRKVNVKHQVTNGVKGDRRKQAVEQKGTSQAKQISGNSAGSSFGESQKLKGGLSTETDDDDYRAVDDISESDEGDEGLERLEEEMIIASYAGMDIDADFPVLPDPPASLWESFGNRDQLFLADADLFEGVLNEVHGDAFLPSNLDSEQAETPRRVHFADEVDDTSTDSSSSDTESNQFSDTFLQQDRLAPSLLTRIEHDSDDEDVSLSENEWDLRQDGLLEYEHYGLDNDDDSVNSEGSGYETDDGDTTDEDLPPPTTVAHPGSILQEDTSDSSSGGRSQLCRRKFPRRHSLNGPATPRTADRSLIPQTGPRMGFWVADPTKAAAYIGPTGKLMLIQPARRSTRNPSLLVDSSSGSQQSLYELLNDSEQDTSTPPSPMLTENVNLMMSGLFHGNAGNEFLRGGQVVGPPEAFYPWRNVGPDGTIEEFSDDDAEFDENMLDVEDFIDFGNGSSTEGDDRDVMEVGKGKSKALVASKNSAQYPLSHLDGSNVTAFRRHTNRVHAYLKLPKHVEFMDYSPPGTSSAVKSGRHFEMAAPIAPLRKRKRDNSTEDAESSRGNPVQRKLVNAHKRSKSLF